jgi:DNA-binding NarL/FixJ family response regulator
MTKAARAATAAGTSAAITDDRFVGMPAGAIVAGNLACLPLAGHRPNWGPGALAPSAALEVSCRRPKFPMPPQHSGSLKRVVVVEDDAETRERLRASIAGSGFLEVSGEYASGGEALAALAASAPDVLLVDIGLPDMSGLEVVRFVAARHPACEILVISIFGDESHVLAALEAGAGGYLLKGAGERDITFDIRDILSGGSPLSPIIARQVLKRMQSARRDGPPARASAADDTGLTPREREILNAIARGFSYAETGEILKVSLATVHTHLKSIYRKLAVHSKTEAVFEANRLGLIR